MKIIVCLKVCNGEINPFDESTLEYALRLSDDVTVLSMGPESTKDVLTPLTRLGAKVILLSDRIYAGSDTLATSYILSAAIKKMEYDLILCGKQSIDGDTAQVGPMLSSRLNLPLITNALELTVDNNSVFARTREGEESISLPGIITLEKVFYLRFPSIFSKTSEIEIKSNKEIGCNEEKCGIKGSPTKVLKTYENQSGKRKCKFISYDELIPLIKELSSQRKAESEVKNSEKLKNVWAIGNEVFKRAETIGENIKLIEKSTPEKIAELAFKEKPDAILWNSDLWGRKTAPQVAAILNTGLCADCTSLEVRNNCLIMCRPARENSIYAEIECITSPVMATVRTLSKSSDIIISGGKGITDKTYILKELAEILGAEIAASRGLVDAGKFPYELQVGLTGKTVSPAVYIAIGISGAVQHTCAIEGAGTIIAINPDKDARIFEYADYGIIKEI